MYKIRMLMMLVMQYALLIPESYKKADAEMLLTIYNGAGPEKWPAKIRAVLDDFLNLFAPAILVHDYDFSCSIKSRIHFDLANKRFRQNMAIIIRKKFPLWQCWRWSVLKQRLYWMAKAYVAGKFINMGYDAYLEG